MRGAREQGKAYRTAALASSAVLTLAGCVAAGFVGGYYADRWLKTSPWFTAILGLLGVGAGFKELIRLLNRMNEDSANGATSPPPADRQDETRPGSPQE